MVSRCHGRPVAASPPHRSTTVRPSTVTPTAAAMWSRGAMATSVHFHTCPLCEATCGLEISVADGRVQRIRGDQADVFSRGFICPKGSTLKQLHEDPDRLRAPQIRRDGEHVDAT